MTEISAILGASVQHTRDKQTNCQGLLFTTPEAIRLGYFPTIDALRVAAGNLRFNWDNPPPPQLAHDAVVFETADALLSISRRRIFLDFDPQHDGNAHRVNGAAQPASAEPSTPAEPSAAPLPEQKRKPIELRGVIASSIEVRPKRTDPTKFVGEFRIIQTEPPPPPDAPEVVISIFEARGSLKRLREAVATGSMRPGQLITLKGYPQADFVKQGKDGKQHIQRQFNAVTISPVASATVD